MQNVYENKKLVNYKIYANDNKTENMEVIKNIEDISDAIVNLNKVKFEYWKYKITDKLEKVIVSKPVVTPFAIIYNKQEFYMIGVKEGQDKFYNYRIDRIKNLKILNEKRTIKKTQREIQEFAESNVEMFGGEKEEIEAVCSMFLLDTVFEQFGKNITIIKKDEDSFRLIVDANRLGFKFWTLRNIDAVEIIRPKALREEIKKIIKDAEKRYK